MKTSTFFSLIFLTISIGLNAQLKVLSHGRVECKNQFVMFSSPSNISDGADVIYQNPNIPKGYDVFWIYNTQTQPNNPGLLTCQSADGAYFSVRANGYVGIFNNDPSCALEIGTAGTNHQLKVNGNIVLTSDERVKKNVKNIDQSLNKLLLLNPVSYNFIGTKSAVADTVDVTKNNFDIKNKPKFKPQDEKNNTGRSYYGFLAQDVEKCFPDLVYKDSAGVLGVDYIGIIPILVSGLNEQNTTIKAQAQKISDLESRLTKLENTLNSAIKKGNIANSAQ